MQDEKIHIYFVPGLAANPSIFDLITLPNNHFEPHYLEWLVPESDHESIEDYANRMCDHVQHANCILIGVSFGGVMVQEMKKILNPLKTIIISSIKNKHEMPMRMLFAQKTANYLTFCFSLSNHLGKLSQASPSPSPSRR